MLPDLSRLKREVADQLIEFTRSRMFLHLGPLGEVGVVRAFEGSGQSMTRASGEVEDTEWTEVSSGIELSRKEIPSLTLGEVLQRLDTLAADMAGQEARHMYETIGDAAAKVGNSINAGGNPITADLMLEMLDRIQIDFNRDGTPRMPGLHVPPAMGKRLISLGEQIESDPEIKARFDQLMAQKREEWRAREASRKLAG